MTLRKSYGPDASSIMDKTFHSNDEYTKVFIFYADYLKIKGWTESQIYSNNAALGVEYSQEFMKDRRLRLRINTFVPSGNQTSVVNERGYYKIEI